MKARASGGRVARISFSKVGQTFNFVLFLLIILYFSFRMNEQIHIFENKLILLIN